MKKRIGALLMSMMLVSSMLSGCQSGSVEENKDIKMLFAVVESGDYHENWAAMVKEKAEEEGVQVDAEFADRSIEAQVEHIKKAVSEDYDAILCSLVSPDIVTEIKATAGDTPIVFVDSAPDEKKLVADQDIYVASDEITAGQYQAEYVLDKFSDKDEINVVILKGTKGHSATQGRTNGAKQVLEASGKKINYVFEDYANFDMNKAQQLYAMFLKTGKQVDCVICNNDSMALGAIAACENANVDISSTMFLGIDASADGCKAIADGKMAFSVYQSIKGQSEAAVEAAIKLAKGESVQGMDGVSEDGKYVWIPFEKVDSSNVEQYSN